ncbi:hypothetical protein D3C84_744380 [compost metagenome]
MKDVFGPDCVGDVANHTVVLRPQVSERGDQGTRADTRDHLEHGPGSMGSPSSNQPRGECAGITAAGNSQHACQRQDIVRLPGLGQLLAFTFVGLNRILDERRQVVVQPVAGIGYTRDDRFVRQGLRNGVTAWQTGLKKHVQGQVAGFEREWFHNASSGA